MSQEFTLHRNGKGKIHGYEAHVSEDSFVNELSNVDGKSTIHRSTIITSHCRNLTAFSSSITSSWAVNSILFNVELNDHNFIEGVTASECRIEHSILKSVDVLSMNTAQPHLVNVKLENTLVEGGVMLRGGWELKGIARIHDGTWERPPRHIEITGNDIHVGITECTQDRAHIACACRPLKYWLDKREHLKKVLSKRGWLAEQAEKVLLTFEEWADVKLEAA